MYLPPRGLDLKDEDAPVHMSPGSTGPGSTAPCAAQTSTHIAAPTALPVPARCQRRCVRRPRIDGAVTGAMTRAEDVVDLDLNRGISSRMRRGAKR